VRSDSPHHEGHTARNGSATDSLEHRRCNSNQKAVSERYGSESSHLRRKDLAAPCQAYLRGIGRLGIDIRLT